MRGRAEHATEKRLRYRVSVGVVLEVFEQLPGKGLLRASRLQWMHFSLQKFWIGKQLLWLKIEGSFR